MRRPRFELTRVRAAVAEGRMRLGWRRCRETLTGYLDPLQVGEFAREVALLLEEGDFAETIQLGKVTYDVYGVRVRDDVLTRFGLEGYCTWYVKLTIEERGGVFSSFVAWARATARQGGRPARGRVWEVAMSPEVCPACGEGELRSVAREGRRMVFRHVPDLELPATLRIPTCTHCGEEVVDGASLRAIDRAAKRAYAQFLARRAEESIRRLGERIPQREVERLLGLSHGYLSKLKSESAEVQPSAPLVALLMLLASESVLVDRLRELWSAGARLEPAFRWIRPVALSMNVKEGTGTTVEPPARAPDSAGGPVIDALSCAA